jgi:hypothetical protein
MLSWTERARRRGAGMVIFRPPAPHHTELAWHRVQTHFGERVLQFRPGIDVWKDADGQRWTAELAGELKWQWLAADDRA